MADIFSRGRYEGHEPPAYPFIVTGPMAVSPAPGETTGPPLNMDLKEFLKYTASGAAHQVWAALAALPPADVAAQIASLSRIRSVGHCDADGEEFLDEMIKLWHGDYRKYWTTDGVAPLHESELRAMVARVPYDRLHLPLFIFEHLPPAQELLDKLKKAALFNRSPVMVMDATPEFRRLGDLNIPEAFIDGRPMHATEAATWIADRVAEDKDVSVLVTIRRQLMAVGVTGPITLIIALLSEDKAMVARFGEDTGLPADPHLFVEAVTANLELEGTKPFALRDKYRPLFRRLAALGAACPDLDEAHRVIADAIIRKAGGEDPLVDLLVDFTRSHEAQQGLQHLRGSLGWRGLHSAVLSSLRRNGPALFGVDVVERPGRDPNDAISRFDTAVRHNKVVARHKVAREAGPLYVEAATAGLALTPPDLRVLCYAVQDMSQEDAQKFVLACVAQLPTADMSQRAATYIEATPRLAGLWLSRDRFKGIWPVRSVQYAAERMYGCRTTPPLEYKLPDDTYAIRPINGIAPEGDPDSIRWEIPASLEETKAWAAAKADESIPVASAREKVAELPDSNPWKKTAEGIIDSIERGETANAPGHCLSAMQPAGALKMLGIDYKAEQEAMRNEWSIAEAAKLEAGDPADHAALSIPWKGPLPYGIIHAGYVVRMLTDEHGLTTSVRCPVIRPVSGGAITALLGSCLGFTEAPGEGIALPAHWTLVEDGLEARARDELGTVRAHFKRRSVAHKYSAGVFGAGKEAVLARFDAAFEKPAAFTVRALEPGEAIPDNALAVAKIGSPELEAELEAMCKAGEERGPCPIPEPAVDISTLSLAAVRPYFTPPAGYPTELIDMGFEQHNVGLLAPKGWTREVGKDLLAFSDETGKERVVVYRDHPREGNKVVICG